MIPPEIRLPEPFLGYRCNLQGCCCGGWGITWTAEDLARLRVLLPADEFDALVQEHVQLIVGEDGQQVLGARLNASREGGRCHLLSGDGRCTLQQRFGVEALPAICADFPVVPYRLAGSVELAFRFTCPAVLSCIFASTEPVRWTELTALDEMNRSRLQRIGPEPEVRVDGEALTAVELVQLRERVLAPFNDRSRPTLELLAEVESALSRVRSKAEVERFAVVPDGDPLPFVRYLLHCVRTHAASFLLGHLQRHARFVIGTRLPALDDAFAGTLEHWEEALLRYIDPVEPVLRPYLQRYLWLRFASCFVSVQGELRYVFGEPTHELAIALRYLAALCAARDEQASPALLEIALGAAAHLFHTHIAPIQSRIWFAPEDFRSDQPPPPQVPDDLQPELFDPPVRAWQEEDGSR